MAGLVLAIFLSGLGCAVAVVTSQLCQLTGTLFNQDGTLAVGIPVKFSTLNIGSQNILNNSVCTSGGVVVPQTRTVYTDSNGQLPIPLNFPQCAFVDVSINKGQPQRIQIPTNSSIDLDTLLLAVTDPPALISQIACTGCTVINPPLGTVGNASITVNAGTGFPLTGNVSATGFLIQQLGTPSANGDALSWGNPISASSLIIPGGGALDVTGVISGDITILGQHNSGTYNFNLPTTAGGVGALLYSGGGGSTPMNWLADVVGGSVLASNPGHPVWVTTMILGANGGNLGVVQLEGSTSGSVILEPFAAAGASTLKYPVLTGTGIFMLGGVGTIALPTATFADGTHCGASGTITSGGTTNAFIVNMGSTVSTTVCPVTFGANCTTGSSCQATDESTFQALKAVGTSSGVTITAATDMHGDVVDVHCSCY